VDYKAAGLADFSKPSTFYQRQIWALQKASAVQAAVVDEDGNALGEIPRIDDIIQWLRKNEIPNEAAIVHGDFKVEPVCCEFARLLC
jgi:aminoglycoside phosphotransferase (APT) family kinase protein